MNPNMAVHPSNNSQIAGSNVITVSFLSEQFFQFVEKNEHGKFKVVSKFLTEHGSIYCMDADDDLHYYHQTKWPRKKNHNCPKQVRICITFRWLGKRQKFLGSDYNGRCGDRKHTPAVFARQIMNKNKSRPKKTAYKKITALKHK